MNKNIIKNSIIEFGMYPQSLMTKDVKIVSTSPDENGYYTGSDGEKYVLQKANPCDNCMTFSNNEKIEKDKEYYFKLEPIKWQVLDVKDNTALLFSTSILNAIMYDENSTKYEDSMIRSWLNYYMFYDVAFSKEQKNLIKVSLIENLALTDDDSDELTESYTTEDKVFILSLDEIMNTEYGFSNNFFSDEKRSRKVTDYAKANKADADDDNQCGDYWLRTPDEYEEYNMNCVTCSGHIICDYYIDYTIGVVPALRIKIK